MAGAARRAAAGALTEENAGGAESMTTADEIKQAVLNLPEAEYASLMEWLHELAEEAWDREFEEDVRAGRLDALAEEALEAKRQGRLRDLCSA